MKVNICYLDKVLILSDEKNIHCYGRNVEINEYTRHAELKQIIFNWLNEKNTDNLYLFFNNASVIFYYLLMFFTNIFKVMYASGGLIKHNDKGYLFIYKRGYWDLPKGKIDEGENPETAAIRECMEETGVLKVNIQKNLGLTFHIFNQKNKWILKITQWYLMESSDNHSLLPQLEEDIEKTEWVKQEDIQKYILPKTYFSVKEVLHRAGLISEEV